MIMVILFIYLVNSLMTPTTHGAIDFKSEKPIMCFYDGKMFNHTKPRTVALEPTNIPDDCDLIVYSYFLISITGEITSDTDVISKLTSLGKPVYLIVNRENKYVDWITVLNADGNATDAKAVTDFAVANNVQGVIFWCISPVYETDVPNYDIGKNIVPYLKQVKINPDFVVGLFIQPWNTEIMVDPCIYNYDELNNVVDFYVVNSFLTLACDPSRDTITPNHKTEDTLFGIDSIDQALRTTSINCDMIYFIIDFEVELPFSALTSYGQVCRGRIDCKTWCIPTTKGLYEQAKFIKDLKYGISVQWIEFDDIYDACGCGPFVGLQNMVAGYNGAPQIPCEKFDIKLSCPP